MMMRKWKFRGRPSADEADGQAKNQPFAWLGLSKKTEPGEKEGEEEEVVRLWVPTRDEVEIRSHDPDIEDLIEDEEDRTNGTLEEQWGNAATKRRPLPWGWFVLIGLALSGGAIWSLIHIRFADRHLETIRLETGTLLDREEASILEAQNLMERIEASLQAYVMASDLKSRIQVVRQPDRVRKLMEDHYSRHPFDTYGKPRIDNLHPLTLGTYGNYWMAALVYDDGARTSLIVEADEKGPARVDWETAVCYQPMDWDVFARKRPEGTSMDFRVYVQPDSLFSHEFQDASAWNSYQVTARDSEEMLFGYVRANTPSAELLREWFRRNPDAHHASMILRLSIPDGLASPRGVVIEEVLSVRWIYVVPPDGE